MEKVSALGKTESNYQGFEQGPIRPPSEAHSLLIRVTRNCPWNKCTFCPVYKGAQFSLRPVDHVIQDIDTVHGFADQIRKKNGGNGSLDRNDVEKMAAGLNSSELQALQAAINWSASGMQSVFLQDANSLILKPQDLVKILKHMKNRFPWVQRVTSYARSHTVARISEDDMGAIAEAGLNRIHIGMESGSDKVLKMIRKGTDKATHIKAGRRVKTAGIELSEYVMPGLGGRALSREHALETADALNQIDPEFIRLRTLAILNVTDLFKEYDAGRFEKCTDQEAAEEILVFIENLDGISSMIVSDHVLNLFEDVKGRLPEDKSLMTGIIRSFLDMSPEKRVIYQVGRRLGIFHGISDMADSRRELKARETCQSLGITPQNVDQTIDELMKRFL
jgi:radical SAM family protein